MTDINCKPTEWDDFPFGDILLQQLDTQLSDWCPKVFGYHLLKLGCLSSRLSTLHCPVSRHYCLHDQPNADLVADPHYLPLQANSIDAVISSFLLEYERDPYQILREVDRVLISGGYVFIAGFNPISPVFLGKILPQYQLTLPWSGQFFMPSRVKDWLKLLGYTIIADERLMYHSMISLPTHSKVIQKYIAQLLPSTGSVYFIVARKLESPLTPIKDRSKLKAPNWAAAPSAGRNVVKSNKQAF